MSSCESDDVDYGPISAAIEIGVEEVTPSSAKIRLTTEQENVASYKIVKPTPISEFEYAAHDAIDRLAFIEERGEAAGAPFEQTLAGLMPKVEYSFAVVGLDASGQRITAPTFARFTTAYASSLVEARFETNPDETFTFTGKITPNAYTVSYRYIFDSDHNEAHRGRAQGAARSRRQRREDRQGRQGAGTRQVGQGGRHAGRSLL